MTEFELRIAELLTAETEEQTVKAKKKLRGLMEADSIVAKPPLDKSNLESEVRRVLLDLGVPDHILGHRYLIAAISAAVEDPSIIQAITGELYPKVAKLCGTTSSRVERASRHAIEVCWDRGDLDVLKEYFGNTISLTKGKPTNSEFIARVANVIRQRA